MAGPERRPGGSGSRASSTIDMRFPKTEFSFAKIEFDGASGLSTYIMSKWPSGF
jgi:hypothetical protein